MLDDYKLMEKKGKYFPYEYLETALYGYNNKYALLIRRAYGGIKSGNTIGAREGKYEVNLCGILIKKSDMKDKSIAYNNVKDMVEVLTDEEWEIVKSKLLESSLSLSIDEVKRTINLVSKEELEIISEIINQLEEKESHKKIKFRDYLTYQRGAKPEDYFRE